MSYMPLNIMPLMLGSAADTFNLDNRTLGNIGSAFLLGFTLLSITAYFWIDKFGWRLTLAGTSLSVAFGFALMVYFPFFVGNYLFWTVLGFLAAAPYTIVVRILSEAPDTNRAFGCVTAVQIGSSAILLWMLPNVFMMRWGYDSIVVALALGFIIAVPGLLLVPKRAGAGAAAQTHRTAVSVTGDTLPVWFALAGAFIFISGQIGLWAFLERIGHSRGIAVAEIGMTLAILKLIGAAAGISMFMMGRRIVGRVPHVLCTACVASGLLLLAFDHDGRHFAIGAWLWEYGYSLYYIYLCAYIAVIDRSHRLVVLTPAAVACGAAIGPYVAGHLAHDNNFVPVMVFAGVSITIPAMLMSLRPALRIEQNARRQSGEVLA